MQTYTKDNKRTRIEEKTQVDTNQVLKYIETIANQHMSLTLFSTTKTNQRNKTRKKPNTALVSENKNNSRNHDIVILMRKLFGFRELFYIMQ